VSVNRLCLLAKLIKISAELRKSCFGLLLVWCIEHFFWEHFDTGGSHLVEDVVVFLVKPSFLVKRVVLVNCKSVSLHYNISVLLCGDISINPGPIITPALCVSNL